MSNRTDRFTPPELYGFEPEMPDIVMTYVNPPVPCRDWDWQATWDDYDPDPDARHPVGRGPTPEAAIEDLKIETELRA